MTNNDKCTKMCGEWCFDTRTAPCSCPCHFPQQVDNPQPQSEWELELNDRLQSIGDGTMSDEIKKEALKDFIRSLLLSDRLSLIKKLEGLKVKELYIGETQYIFYKGNVDWVHNTAIDSAISLLKDNK